MSELFSFYKALLFLISIALLGYGGHLLFIQEALFPMLVGLGSCFVGSSLFLVFNIVCFLKVEVK